MKFFLLALVATISPAIQASANFKATSNIAANQFQSISKSLAQIKAIADRKSHAHISSQCAYAQDQIARARNSWGGISSKYSNYPWTARLSPQATVVKGGLSRCGGFLSWIQTVPEFQTCPEYRAPVSSCRSTWKGCQTTCGQIWNWPSPPKPSGLKNDYYKRHASPICPANETACPIGYDSQSTECIDTQSEITSCGGCTSIGKGENCLSIKGADEVGCDKGKCVVFSVHEGYQLHHGRAIAK